MKRLLLASAALLVLSSLAAQAECMLHQLIDLRVVAAQLGLQQILGRRQLMRDGRIERGPARAGGRWLNG